MRDAINTEQRLDALLNAYRASCPDPDISAAFMPKMWERIDARKWQNRLFRRVSMCLATASAALAAVYFVYSGDLSGFPAASNLSGTYAEAISTGVAEMAVYTESAVTDADYVSNDRVRADEDAIYR